MRRHTACLAIRPFFWLFGKQQRLCVDQAAFMRSFLAGRLMRTGRTTVRVLAALALSEDCFSFAFGTRRPALTGIAPCLARHHWAGSTCTLYDTSTTPPSSAACKITAPGPLHCSFDACSSSILLPVFRCLRHHTPPGHHTRHASVPASCVPAACPPAGHRGSQPCAPAGAAPGALPLPLQRREGLPQVLPLCWRCCSC